MVIIIVQDGILLKSPIKIKLEILDFFGENIKKIFEGIRNMLIFGKRDIIFTKFFLRQFQHRN
jgi:hypothetical protein